MLKELLRGPSLRRIQVEAFLDKVQCEVVFLQAWKNFFEWPIGALVYLRQRL
jgi:hypothetical protein